MDNGKDGKIMDKIDFVVTWVDGSDKNWLLDKASYSPNGGDIRNTRYQDWDQLKYWFRSIEMFAPWVNKIHFVTYGHIPKWLNTDNEKINIVKHSDFIPEQYLPVFNSTAIEAHLHRIPNLSEKFVYFCDDFYLMKPCKEQDFFVKNRPADNIIFQSLPPHNKEMYFYILYNDFSVYSQYVSKKSIIKNFFKFFNLKYRKAALTNLLSLMTKNLYIKPAHLPTALLKSSMAKIWQEHKEEMEATANSRFRQMTNISPEAIRGYQLITGNFHPKYIDGHIVDTRNVEKVKKMIETRKHKFLCLSDNTLPENFEKSKEAINSSFDKIFPNRSSFECEN